MWRLALALAEKDVRHQYGRSAFDLAFSLFQPVFTMAVFMLIFFRIAGLGSEGRPYAAFSLIALAPWTFVSSCARAGASCLLINSSLVTRLYFPRMAIPLAVVLTQAVPFLLNTAVLVIVLAASGVPLRSPTLVWLLPIAGVQMALAVGLALHLSVLTTRFRALQSLLALLLQGWLLVSPIAYSTRIVPQHWMPLYRLNPMTGIVDGYRSVLLHHAIPSVELMTASFLVSIVLLVSGIWMFRRLERDVADAL